MNIKKLGIAYYVSFLIIYVLPLTPYFGGNLMSPPVGISLSIISAENDKTGDILMFNLDTDKCTKWKSLSLKFKRVETLLMRLVIMSWIFRFFQIPFSLNGV